MELEPLYKPQGVEERWQQTWEQERLYPGDPDGPGPTYVIAVPPPNVTGELHMGHALNGTLQDVLVRQHRMRGFNTLWQPGFDHAGIATQDVAEGVPPGGHRDPGRRRARASRAGKVTPGARPRRVRRAGLGVAARVRR